MRRFLGLLPFVALACSRSGAPAPADWNSGTRLQAQVYHAGDSKLFQTWHDTKLDIDCTFASAPDGALRCLPANLPFTSSFSDSDCTQPIVQLRDAATCANPPYFEADSKGTGSGPKRQLYKTGPRTAWSTIYTFNSVSGACSPADNDYAYAPGVAVDASEFVAAQSSTQPKGAQLALETLHADDGAVEARAISDQQRNFPCDIQTVDAIDRCVPTKIETTDGVFSDASCTTPVAATFTFLAAPGAIRSPDFAAGVCLSAAALESNLYEVGAPLTTLFDTSSGVCAAATAETDEVGYPIGAPMPVSSLAELDYRQEGGGQVVVRAVSAPTGERLRADRLYDTHFQAVCQPELAADGKLRCLPLRFAIANSYSDSHCSVAIVSEQSGCAAPTVAASTDPVTPQSCEAPVPFHVFKVGKPVTPTSIYQIENKDCVDETGAFVGLDFYLVGDEIPATSFEQVTITAE